jgi:subtilase family serine protease
MLLTACTTLTDTATPTPTSPDTGVCPGSLHGSASCFTPRSLRLAYDIQALTDRGFTGKGQTVVDIVSYGSPTLQQDMDVFDRQFGLPAITIRVLSPLGTVPFDPTSREMAGWAVETELDVQIIHAIAPDAGIVVLTSPVDETEGTAGLPQFQQLEQYAVTNHLGQIFSQSWEASEVSLADSAGQQEVQTYATFYQQITTQNGVTVVSGSGDQGASDYLTPAMDLSPTPTVGFPDDVPWVTAVGGTSLLPTGSSYQETAWSGSNGGVSRFFTTPSFQTGLPSSVQTLLAGHRGVPDVSGNADPMTGMAFYVAGHWDQTGGTSASTPLWAGIIAIANQMAGHPLGFINPGLYKLAESPSYQQDFRDITSGNNSVSQGNIQLAGNSATPGWDAVTGLGSPLCSHLVPDLIAALK